MSETKCIAISRQQGSGGSYIGRAVAGRLGFRYFDREMLRTVAEYMKEHEHDSHDEQRPGSWFDRLGTVFSFGTLETGYVPPSPTVLYEGALVGIENRLIREIVDEHVAVIVGRGAAQMLRGRPGVVTVFLHAPEERRVAEWTDPRCYDLAINSMSLGLDATVDLIVRSVITGSAAASTTGV
jgi:CMP/dCMP kinase